MLNASWAVLPPPAIALRRIGLVLGIKPADAAPPARTTPDAALREAQTAGLPVMQGRPDDPLLNFLDLPPRS